MANLTNIYSILAVMIKITDDPKMLELIEMLKKEVDKIK